MCSGREKRGRGMGKEGRDVQMHNESMAAPEKKTEEGGTKGRG